MMTFSNLVCALGFTLVAACSSVGPSVNPGSTGGTSGTGGTGVTGTCVENVLCIRGDHFDTTLCKCVPDADAGPVCVDNVLCIRGDHFDTTLCKCVPDADAGPVCIDNVLCISGDHFDTTLCKCVPDQAGNECKTAADCKGALPALCERCASGSTACAHFECVAGACETVICPATN